MREPCEPLGDVTADTARSDPANLVRQFLEREVCFGTTVGRLDPRHIGSVPRAARPLIAQNGRKPAQQLGLRPLLRDGKPFMPIG